MCSGGRMARAREPHPLNTFEPLWDQQPEESVPAYEAFILFRDMGRGERTQEGVAGRLGKTPQLIGRWNAVWSWRQRVIAWDKNQAAHKLDEHWEEVEKMSKRHKQHAQVMGQFLIGPAMSIFTLMQERPNLFLEYFSTTDDQGRSIIDFDRMDRVVSMAMTAARIMPLVQQMERVAVGLPAEIKGEDADPTEAAKQYLIGDPVKLAKAQELFAVVHGVDLPKLPAAVMGPVPEGEDGDDQG